jgi:hypothetical protein
MDPDRISRMKSEHAELGAKIEKVRAFYNSPVFAKLPKGEQERICRQHAGMCQYHDALGERIHYAEHPEPRGLTCYQVEAGNRINEAWKATTPRA